MKNYQPMSRLQWQMVILCVWLNIIDGIDVMIIAFTASSISEQLMLNQSALAWLISIGLIGMTVGAIWLGPFGDKYGRKPMITLCLLICSISLTLIGFFDSYWEIFILRFTAGIGIGGILSSSNVLCNEYASVKNKGLAVSLLSVGYALGAVVGGFIALNVIKLYGWQTVFIIAGGLTFVTIIMVQFFLYESVAILQSRHDVKSQNTLQKIFQKEPSLANLQASNVHATEGKTTRYLDLFKGELGRKNILLCLAIGLTMFGFQFIMTWTPKLLGQLNSSESLGISAGIILSIGGMIGALLVGFGSRHFALSNLQKLFLSATAIITFGFIASNEYEVIFYIVGFCLGLSLNGSVASLYAYMPSIYPAEIRTSGVGLAMGIGRIGGILSPLFAGFILDQGASIMQTYAIFTCSFILALVIVFLLNPTKAKANNVSLAEV